MKEMLLNASPLLPVIKLSLPIADPVYLFSLLLIAIALAPSIAARLHIPALVVLISLGTLLGTNGLGILARDSQLILLEKVGLLYIMLLAGLQIDLSNLRQLGLRSLSFGILTFALPFGMGILSARSLGYPWLTAALMGMMYSPHTLVSFPIVTQLGLVQREAIGVAVGGTVVTSVLTLVGLSILQAVTDGSVGLWFWIKVLVALPILIQVCFWGLPRWANQQLKPDSKSLISQYIFVLASLFVTASATLLLGIDAIVGAFIAGLALNRSIPLQSPLMQQIEFVGNSLFIPVFLISVGVLCNPRIFVAQPGNLGLAAFVIVGAVGAKFAAAWIAGQRFHYSFAEVMTMLGLTMSRAALVLVIALFGRNANIISEGIFNAVIVYIILTCLVGPLVTDRFGTRAIERSPQ